MEGTRLVTRLQDLHLQPGHTVDANESVENLVQIIKSQKSTHRTFVVMDGTRPIGIVRSNDMFRMLGTHFGVALHYKKRMKEVMYTDILVVDRSATIVEVSRKAMARSYEDIYDDVVVTNDDQFVGVIPVYELLTYIIEWEVREAAQKNPLSGLPGNERIEAVLAAKCSSGGNAFSFIYIDIDHFKSYNDVYGFKHGDDMIKWTSKLLQSPNVQDLFVGHIGGDDFAVCLPLDEAESYCQQVIDRFEQEKAVFYTEEDNLRNYIVSLDRNHQLNHFPLVSLSMAVIDVDPSEPLDISQIPLLAAVIKKQAKQTNGSVYCRGILQPSC